jgi:hypothetical protein
MGEGKPFDELWGTSRGKRARPGFEPLARWLAETSPTDLALRFVVDRAIALPRLHRTAHLVPALAAAAAPPLSADLGAEIDQIFERPA